jgi:YVTN family beta-propeller protein
LVRPNDVRGLPGCTPTGFAFSPDESRIYVTLGDMNAVAVVDARANVLLGYIPVGWYPTSVVVSPDGRKLFVANAKGVASRNPNKVPAGTDGKNGRYIQNIIEGTVSVIPVPNAATLAQSTQQVIANNRITPTLDKDARKLLANPGIEHVIYIIKENRTYDQVLGDLPQGNGDPSLCLFPREVTPNQHALAERFVLLDNFYCCAEVSADGWNWSVSGMVSEYTSRNAPYNYSGRGRNYDFEGQNNGSPVDLLGYADVARSPSGYIWELCAKHKVPFRNYGFYCNFVDAETRSKVGGKYSGEDNAPNKKILEGKTDQNFRLYDLTYADSEAHLKHGIASPYARKTFGKFNAPSRISEWRREYEQYVQSRTMPRFMMVRFGNDHTRGTATGAPSPRAMVADNDYAVGQLVETVSRSPYWHKTAIFILEDDAQNGFDHVDAHRSIAFVISPFIAKGTIDSTFYNTDSTLRTMELLLGLPPMCQYDAVATPIAVFGKTPDNDAPYTALLPSKSILSEINGKQAYRAEDSRRLIRIDKEDATPDAEMNDILWHALKGRETAKPPVRYGLRLGGDEDEEEEREKPQRTQRTRRKTNTNLRDTKATRMHRGK